MRCARVVFVSAPFLVLGLGGLLTLSGCGNDTGPGGVKVGGAKVDPDVEARDKQAAAEEAALKKK